MGDRRNSEQIIARITAALSGEPSNAHQATALAHDLYLLSLEREDDATVDKLVHVWRAISAHAFPDLLETRVAYFLRLARDSSPLIFEELLKLLSLGEDIHVLMTFGAAISSSVMTELEDALRSRLARQPELRTAAQSLVQPWSRGVWCYQAVGATWGH